MSQGIPGLRVEFEFKREGAANHAITVSSYIEQSLRKVMDPPPPLEELPSYRNLNVL